jgi:hypothetical protein
MGPCLAVEGGTTREVFEAYVEHVLVPPQAGAGDGDGQPLFLQGREGQGANRGEGRCELIYLPPYSLDLNPIEESLAKVKASIRKFELRTREALVEAMGRSLDALTARDTRGFFEHCSYQVAGQLL